MMIEVTRKNQTIFIDENLVGVYLQLGWRTTGGSADASEAVLDEDFEELVTEHTEQTQAESAELSAVLKPVKRRK